MSPDSNILCRIAQRTLIGGLLVMGLKFGIFFLTGSAAVLTDALESIINIIAATVMLYSVRLAAQPADEDHPYGHGKVEFLSAALEGAMILAAGLVIAYVGIKRLLVPVELEELDLGSWLLLGVNGINGGLAAYVLWAGRKYQSTVLLADGKHLLTDVGSTFGVVIGLFLVRYTGWKWLDPAVAIIMACLILFTSWRLLRQSFGGLMDKSDPRDDARIRDLLDAEIVAGAICGYHKVRHRHVGRFHWVDMHLQVHPDLTVRQSHALASRIEYAVEQMLGEAKATAHMEPCDKSSTSSTASGVS